MSKPTAKLDEIEKRLAEHRNKAVSCCHNDCLCCDVEILLSLFAEQEAEIKENQQISDRISTLIMERDDVRAKLKQAEKENKRLTKEILEWWEEHKYDVNETEDDQYNVYDYEPDFVKTAQIFSKLKEYGNVKDLSINEQAEKGTTDKKIVKEAILGLPAKSRRYMMERLGL